MKTRFLVISALFAGVVLPIQAQNWTWAETAGGVLPDEANGCFLDEAGNMYMSGFYFSSDINFGNGNQLSNNGLSDGFTVKYNPNGTTQWASKVKGSAEDKATKCTADRFGNVYTTGYFDSPSIQFGGNNNDNVSNSDNSGGTFDAFIVKYNSSGTPQWYHSIGEEDDDGGSSLATDSLGNVYVTGWFRAPSIAVSSVTIYNTNPAGGSSDMFLIKYGPGGNVLWAKGAGGPDDDKGRGCSVDPDGNVIVTGYFKAPSITIEGTTYPNSGSKDSFVIKYAADGTFIGAKTYGASGGEEAFACSTDGDGNVFLCGNYSSSTVTFDGVTMNNPGSGSGAFLLKLDPSLNAVWARGFSSDSNDEARGCYADSYGNSVVTGVFSGNSLTIGNNSLNNNGGDEIFLAKYDPNGNLFWATKIGKSNDDGSNDCNLSDNGKIVIAGYYNSGSLTLGNIDLDNSYFGIATSDVFIGTTCAASMGTETATACNSFTWMDGNTYTASSNSAVFSFSNGGNACDSIITLDLTINSVDTSVTATSTSLNANSNSTSYRWLDCDNSFSFLSGETSQSYSPTVNGSYAVEITDNGCVDTSNCYVLNAIAVGVSENGVINTLKVYPNPSIGSLMIEVDYPLNNVTLSVRNVLGECVYTEHFVSFKKTEISSVIQKGIYFIELRTHSEYYVAKALKL